MDAQGKVAKGIREGQVEVDEGDVLEGYAAFLVGRCGASEAQAAEAKEARRVKQT